jgi:hypothetical protein
MEEEMKQQVLRVLLVENTSMTEVNLQTTPLQIVFTDFLLSKLKEFHGERLIPVLQRIHGLYVQLSDFILNLQGDILEG